MQTTMVKVPGALLLDRQLTDSAKLLWMILQLAQRSDLPASSPGLLGARSGLSQPTVRRGLVGLRSAGWLPSNGGGSVGPDWAFVPDGLLLDHRVGVQARLLYGSLQLTTACRANQGQCSYTELSGLTGVSLNTIKSAARELAHHGWLAISQRNRLSPVHFTLRNPVAERREGEVAGASRRLEASPFVGEALMREYLSLLIDSDEYDDNASPGYLVNPLTGEEMQFDRYYPPHVAFEYNGPQHYAPTDRYASEVDVRKQQARDYIKLGISSARGIQLVVVHAADLSLAAMRAKVEGLLPLRDLHGHAPLIGYLESVSRSYRRKARQERWSGRGRASGRASR